MQDKRIDALVQRLARLSTVPPQETALLGFLAGALYALRRAADHGYTDGRAVADPRVLDHEAHEVLEAIGAGDAPPETWPAGFYLNDAAMRLAALNERLDKYAESDRDLAPTVRKAVNDLKHEVDPHLGRGLELTLDEVVQAAESLVGAFEADLRRGKPH